MTLSRYLKPIRRYSHAVGIEPRQWSTVPLWILGAMLMLAFTINDLCPVISDYFDDDVNVNVQISVSRNKPIRNPQLFFCLPIPSLSASSHYGKLKRNLLRKDANCTECEELERRSWDVWSNFNRNSTTFLVDILDAFEKKIFSSNLTEIVRNQSMIASSKTDWRKPIIDVVWITLLRISKLDAAFRNGTLNRGRWHADHSKSDQIDPLLNGMIEFLCNFIEIDSQNGSDTGGNCSDTDCIGECINILTASAAIKGSDNTFCFQLPWSGSFQLKIKQQFFDYLVARKPFSIYFENPVFSGSAEFLYRSPFPEGGQVSMRKDEKVNLGYSIVSKVIEERDAKQSFQDRSQIDCLTKCKTDVIMKTCHCYPFTTRAIANANHDRKGDIDYCTVQDYMNCTGKIDTSGCSARCATAQVHTTYQWIIDKTTINSVKPGFTLAVAPLVRPYLEFTMAYRDSRAKLISQVGGVFNFYLGWSGLSLIVFIIYFMNAFTFWRHSRRDVHAYNVQTGQMWLNVFWQWKWSQLTRSVTEDTKERKASRIEVLDLKSHIDQIQEEMRVEMTMLRNELMQKMESTSTSIDIGSETGETVQQSTEAGETGENSTEIGETVTTDTHL